MSAPIKTFDYESLDPETREFLREKRGRICERTARAVVENGRDLIEVKGRLDHGQFGKWIAVEFGMSDRIAQHLMNVAATFKSEKFSDLPIARSALYMLAAPSVPEEAREEAIATAEQGRKVTHADAKRIIAEKKPPAPDPEPAPDRKVEPKQRAAAEVLDTMAPSQRTARINGVESADPPDVARLRAAGRIAPDSVVVIDEPDPIPDEPEDAPDLESEGEVRPAEPTDDEWLDEMPQRGRLGARNRKLFDEQALAYRRLEEARRSYAHHANRVLKPIRRRGPFSRRVRSFLGIEHPRHWNVCPPVDKGGCDGSGEVPMIGECPKCHGAGFWIK